MLSKEVTTDTYTQLCHLWVIVVNLTRMHARTHTFTCTLRAPFCVPPLLSSPHHFGSPFGESLKNRDRGPDIPSAIVTLDKILAKVICILKTL